QGAGGFVGDQQLRFERQRRGDQGALAHRAGELMGVLAGPGGGGVEADLLEQFEHAGLDLLAVAPAVDTQRLGDARADGAHGVQGAGGVLRDQADAGAAQLAPGTLGQTDELLAPPVGAREGDGAAGDGAVVGEQTDRRLRGGGLAGAGFAHQGGDRAARDGEVDAAHRFDGSAAGAVGDAEGADLQQRLGLGGGGLRGLGLCVGTHACSLFPMALVRRLVDSTTAATTRPGSRVSHQAEATQSRRAEVSRPHSEVGDGAPGARKPSVGICRIADPSCSAASAITGAAELGRMWRHRMAGRVPPEPKAASTYSLWRTASTRERDRRAKVAIEVMPTAIAALVVPKPSRITTDSDSSRPGMANSTSTTRIRASSTRPPTAPAITPMVVPTTRPTVTATIAAVIEWEAPWTTR